MDIVAHIFAVLIFITILFQLALAAGMPWGELAMGGKHPGRFPPSMRIGAVVQAIILGLLAVVVYTRAGMMLPGWYAFSETAIWFVVGICAISTVLNLITPSKWERILWAPIAIIMLACSLIVALR